jgi:hypothetical protein
MAIDFTMSAEQRKIQKMAREFSENVLAPVIPASDKEPDPMLAYRKTKGAYIKAYKTWRCCQKNTAAPACHAWTM